MIKKLFPKKKKIDKRNNKASSIIFLITPYITTFTIFVTIPVFMSMFLSLTYFNAIEAPEFIGLSNFVNIFTQDEVFMTKVLPNTIKFALIVGPGGYILSFLLAWMLAQIPSKLRTVLALAIYAPSMVGGIFISIIWKTMFSGDHSGYLNALLLNWDLIDQPIQWLTSPEHLMNIMILVSLWGSMGVGFLAMLAGILNINKEMYEAAYIDGLSNRFQEIIYITIPSMKPQMLFGAVMSLVNTFQVGSIGVQLSGQNPTPQYSGQLILTHMEDYGFIRYEMGYASAIAVVLLIFIYLMYKVVHKLFGEKD